MSGDYSVPWSPAECLREINSWRTIISDLRLQRMNPRSRDSSLFKTSCLFFGKKKKQDFCWIVYDLRPHDWQRKTSGLDLEFTFTWILDFLLRVRKSWSVNWFPINMYSFRILKLTGQDMIHFVYFEILIRTRILFTVNDNLLRRFVWKFLAVWERFLIDRRGPIHDSRRVVIRESELRSERYSRHVSHSSRDDGRMKSVHHVARSRARRSCSSPPWNRGWHYESRSRSSIATHQGKDQSGYHFQSCSSFRDHVRDSAMQSTQVGSSSRRSEGLLDPKVEVIQEALTSGKVVAVPTPVDVEMVQCQEFIERTAKRIEELDRASSRVDPVVRRSDKTATITAGSCCIDTHNVQSSLRSRRDIRSDSTAGSELPSPDVFDEDLRRNSCLRDQFDRSDDRRNVTVEELNPEFINMTGRALSIWECRVAFGTTLTMHTRSVRGALRCRVRDGFESERRRV